MTKISSFFGIFWKIFWMKKQFFFFRFSRQFPHNTLVFSNFLNFFFLQKVFEKNFLSNCKLSALPGCFGNLKKWTVNACTCCTSFLTPGLGVGCVTLCRQLVVHFQFLSKTLLNWNLDGFGPPGSTLWFPKKTKMFRKKLFFSQ